MICNFLSCTDKVPELYQKYAGLIPPFFGLLLTGFDLFDLCCLIGGKRAPVQPQPLRIVKAELQVLLRWRRLSQRNNDM